MNTLYNLCFPAGRRRRSGARLTLCPGSAAGARGSTWTSYSTQGNSGEIRSAKRKSGGRGPALMGEGAFLSYITGCSLNIVFFSNILKYIPDSGLSRFPLGVSVCVHNGRLNTSAAAAELAEFRKIKTF